MFERLGIFFILFSSFCILVLSVVSASSNAVILIFSSLFWFSVFVSDVFAFFFLFLLDSDSMWVVIFSVVLVLRFVLLAVVLSGDSDVGSGVLAPASARCFLAAMILPSAPSGILTHAQHATLSTGRLGHFQNIRVPSRLQCKICDCSQKANT